MSFTAIVGYHLNPLTCGVARFNQELAKRLGVPFVGLCSEWGSRPLLSLKWSELDTAAMVRLMDRCESIRNYSVLWHGPGNDDVSAWASREWLADRDLFCPPAPLPDARLKPCVQLFAFGMAHKMAVEPYAKVRALCERVGKAFDLRVSVALHEGTSLDDALFHELAPIVGADNLKVLGCLSDYALAEELQDAHAVCAFFPGGVKSNNTSVHTAMQAGAPVITNLGPLSPPEFQHGVTVFDVAQLDGLPTAQMLRSVGLAGQVMSRERFSWERFVGAICAS